MSNFTCESIRILTGLSNTVPEFKLIVPFCAKAPSALIKNPFDIVNVEVELAIKEPIFQVKKCTSWKIEPGVKT